MAAKKETRVKIADLTPHPKNYRRHPAAQLEKLRASLRVHGQQKPVVIDAEGTILAGHGLVEAARAEGWAEIGCHLYDGPYPDAFVIADNASADLAEDDNEALATLLKELEAKGELDASLFSTDDLGSLLAELEAANPAPVEEEGSAALPAERWLIIVECSGENEQLARLEELTEKGWECRAAIS